MNRRFVSLLISLVLLVAACGSPSIVSTEPAVSNSDSPEFVAAMEMIQARSGGVLYLRPYESLEELMPLVTFEVPGSGSFHPVDAVVLGTVTSYEEGPWFSNSMDSGSGQVTVGSEEASWKTVHLTIQVIEDIGDTNVGKKVKVGVAFSIEEDMEIFANGLVAAGPLVFFLTSESAVFSYDSDLYGIVEDGGMIAAISPNGTLSLPGAEADDDGELLSRLRPENSTLDSLRAAAKVRKNVQYDVAEDGSYQRKP